MRARDAAWWRTGVLAATAALIVACSSGALPTTSPTTSASGVPAAVPSVGSAPTAGPAASGAVSRPGFRRPGSSEPPWAGPSGAPATSAPVTVDAITVEYTYTDPLISVLAHLYGSVLDDFAVITVSNANPTPVKVVVSSEVSGFTDAATDTVTVDPGDRAEIRQDPPLRTGAIDELNSEHPASFHLRVTYLDNGSERQVLDQTDAMTVLGRRDFPWSVEGMTQPEAYDLLAALVTPTDPSVEELIRDAADYNPSGTMGNGYNGVDNDDDSLVWNRLAALWQAEEQNYDLTYVSTMVTFAPGDMQRIRLPAEVLADHAGNCIELALLYAAAAEALKLESAIVLIPGHAYVAIRMDATNANYYFVETTLIGRSSFQGAVDLGASEWDDAQPHLDAEEESYGWVTLADARDHGILPVPWR